MTIVQEHPDNIDSSVASKIMDLNQELKVKDLHDQLQPIAFALDQVQRDAATLDDAYSIFLKFLEEPTLDLPLEPHEAKLEKGFM